MRCACLLRSGCQDTVRYVDKYLKKQEQTEDGHSLPELLGTILQAPVSDREWLAGFPELKALSPLAQDMVKGGQGQDILFR